MTLSNLAEYARLKREDAIRKAQKSLWSYCQLTDRDFYQRHRGHLRDTCNDIQDFLYKDSKHDVLIINLPPRFGKSRTLVKTCQWLLGQDVTQKIMTGSYNETLSTTFSKGVRDEIQEERADADKIVYHDIFPDTKIRHGDGAMNLWGLEGGHYNYLATSPSGTATGFGADVLIIDDLIKSAKEAQNERILKEHWEWFTQTMLSRLEGNGKIIICMTRWNVNDLAGRAEKELQEYGFKVKKISRPVMDEETGEMLDPTILDFEQYKNKAKAIGEEVASANYMQQPKNIKGRLYNRGFDTMDAPRHYDNVIAFTDPAASGSDYTAHIVAGEYNNRLHVEDVIYTQKGTDDTIPDVARSLNDYGVKEWFPEANNAFTLYVDNVERILRDEYDNYDVMTNEFAQTSNKRARIISGAHAVQNTIVMPHDWETRWPTFHEDVMAFNRESSNAHDDGPDALTGLVEAYNGEYGGGYVSDAPGW